MSGRRPSGDRVQAVPASSRGAGAARVLWQAVAALAILRLALVFAPNMWIWGLNLQRFLDPVLAWGPWLLAALALIPALARPGQKPLERAGDALARSTPVALAFAAATALVVFANPDRLRYVGDFMLRQGVADQAGRPGVLFPQAQPLDLLLHYHVPVVLQRVAGFGGSLSARLTGALDAAALALFAAVFVRALSLSGGAALAAWAVVVCGGYLGMFTGYAKAVCEVAVLTAAVGAFGIRVAREGRGQIALGVALALAIALHRSALALVPAAVVAWWLGARHAGGRRAATWIGAGVALVALASVLGHVIARARTADIGILLAPPEARAHGLIGSLLAPERIADVLDLIVLLSPLALAAPLLAWRLGRDRLGGREWPVLLALMAPLVLMIVVIQAPQGMFRDWDVYAASGVGLSLVTAALVGETLRGAPRHGWLAVAVTLAVAAPAYQWIAHATDPTVGSRRVAAYLSESPRRSGNVQATSWDWLGMTSYRLRRWDDAAHAWERAAETAPSRRILDQWMRAELARGDLSAAQAVLHRMVARDSTDAQAWLALAGVTSRIPDPADSRHAVRKALELTPDSREAREIAAYLEKNYPEKR